MRRLFILLALMIGSLFFAKTVSAQCGGSGVCCSNVNVTGTCSGGTNPGATCTLSGGCQGGGTCGNWTESCVSPFNTTCYLSGGSCGISCSPNQYWSDTCYPTGSCGSGSIFCGGCINACRPNTQTCTQWINAECSGGGSTPPPGEWCGNNYCASGENCINCGTDCGTCSCSVNVYTRGVDYNISLGETEVFRADVSLNGVGAQVQDVSFINRDPGIIGVVDRNTTNPYRADVTGNAIGTGRVRARVDLVGFPNACGGNADFTVQNTTPPPTADLKANSSDGPITIPSGNYVTLSWTSTNATSCTKSFSASTSTSGSAITGNLTSSVTYTLNCTGPGGSDSDTVTVNVSSTPPSCNIRANNSEGPITINQNTSAILSWTSSNATSCSASGGWSGSKATSGSEGTGNLSSGRTYSITCTGSGGTCSDSVTVNVQGTTAPPAPTCDLRINSQNGTITLNSGQSATLSWSSNNATSCSASGSWSGSKSTSGSEGTGSITSNRSYTLTCTGAGGSCSDSVGVTISSGGGPTPTPTPTATPVPVCVPNCSYPYCGQPDGCGGYCSNSSGSPYLNTPVITSPSSGAVYQINYNTGVASVNMQIQSQAYANRHLIVVERQNGGSWSEVSRFTINGNSHTYNQGTAGSYRMTVRAEQNVCSAVSPWSNYRPFTIVWPAPSCSLSLNPGSNINIRGGQSSNLVANVSPSNGGVSQVVFSPTNSSIISVSPNIDYNSTYQTTLTAGQGGTTTITATATVSNPGGTATCTDTVDVTSGVIQGRVCLAPSANGGSYATGVGANGCFSIYGTCDPVPAFEDNERVRVTSGPQAGTQIPVQANGSFYIPLDPGTHGLRLESDDFLNICECPGGCQYLSATSPENDLKFFYNPTPIRDPWWQVIGGSVYGGSDSGLAVYSPVPEDTCSVSQVVTCVPKLIRRSLLNVTNSSGVVVTGGGGIDTQFRDTGAQDNNLDEDNRNLKSLGTLMTRYVENYDYFARLYGMIDAPAFWADWSNNALNQPGAVPNNSKDAYFYRGNAVINSAWNLNGNASMVVFVDGNLTISSPITVEPGSFLAFIVDGDITISEGVCASDYESTDGVIEGVFVANQNILIAGRPTGTGDCKFVGEGTFVGHGGVVMQRDYYDGDNGPQEAYNSVSPAQLFIFRPDFLINMPDQMKRAMYQWQEVVQ